jgi:hypothetical protein
MSCDDFCPVDKSEVFRSDGKLGASNRTRDVEFNGLEFCGLETFPRLSWWHGALRRVPIAGLVHSP